MHLLGPDLNLEGLAVAADDGSVERLVEVRPWNRDVVLDAARHRAPEVVQDSEHRVAALDAVGDHSDRDEVEYFVDRDLLAPHLVVDAVDSLDAALELRRDVVLAQL